MHALYLPRQGQTMERGTISRWLKGVGEPYQVGDPLFELEYEKASLAIEAKLPGTLAAIVAKEGEDLPVGALLAIVADPGETLTEEQIKAAIARESEGKAAASAPTPAAAAVSASPSGAPKERIRAMPRARALAQQLGIDLAALVGTGDRGAITVEDVQRAARSTAGPRVRERRPLRGIPRAMAESMTRSWREAPQFVQIVLVDATALVARRQAMAAEFKRLYGLDLSNTDLILEAVVKTVQEVPEVNASYSEEAVVLYEDVNLGVAVATDAGLVVPVIKRTQTLALPDLARRLRELAAQARAGSLGPDAVSDGTITVSNLGREGPDTGTPLLMPPQAAIVFVGAMVERPLVVDGAVVARPTFYISNAFDHRVLDGATAARFTNALKRRLEAP